MGESSEFLTKGQLGGEHKEEGSNYKTGGWRPKNAFENGSEKT